MKRILFVLVLLVCGTAVASETNPDYYRAGATYIDHAGKTQTAWNEQCQPCYEYNIVYELCAFLPSGKERYLYLTMEPRRDERGGNELTLYLLDKSTRRAVYPAWECRAITTKPIPLSPEDEKKKSDWKTFSKINGIPH
jgi:hypothetical protein